MEFFKISTLTEKFPNQLAQGKGGKVILAEEGDPWILEKLFTTEGGDNRAIIALRLGMLQVLASLAPVFKPGCNELSGDVRLSLEDENDKFPWRFEDSGENGVTITAREESIPDGVVLPAGGKVFLVWEGTEVKWEWSGGVVPAVPPNALWLLEKIDQTGDALEQVKISLSTQDFVLPLQRFISQENGGVALAVKGGRWFLRPFFSCANKDDPPGAKVNAILAPSLGSLNALAQLAPIFPAEPPAACPAVERRGELGLSVAESGKEYPWEFVERPEGGVTISGLAPTGFPAGGRVYLVWELPNAVKWQFAGGFVEEVPPRARWAVAPVPAAASCGGKQDAVAERAPIASAPPAV